MACVYRMTLKGRTFCMKVALDGVELHDAGISKDDVNLETEFCSPRKFGINNIIQVGGVA